jgi:hypothetical protein
MHAEQAVGVGMLACDDALELVRGQHAAAPAAGTRTGSVRCGG